MRLRTDRSHLVDAKQRRVVEHDMAAADIVADGDAVFWNTRRRDVARAWKSEPAGSAFRRNMDAQSRARGQGVSRGGECDDTLDFRSVDAAVIRGQRKCRRRGT